MRFLALLAAAGAMAAADPAYVAEVEKFRAERLERLVADDGWLTVTGLFWLNQGPNRIGAGAGNEVALPDGKSPALIGTLILRGEDATFEPARGIGLTLNGKPLAGMVKLKPDGEAGPDTIAVNRLKLLFIKRSPRYAIRLKDNDSEIRRNFAGVRWYPVKPEWRFEARFQPQPEGREIVIETIAGNKERYASAGYATFRKDGKEYKLEAVKSGQRLWFIFRDGTSGKTTYAGGRQLYTDGPKDGKVVLDFNKSYNFPCAFTPYTTCPITPQQNRLTLAVEAGEMDYKPKRASGSGD